MKNNKKRGMKCVVPASHTNDLRMETKASFQNFKISILIGQLLIETL